MEDHTKPKLVIDDESAASTQLDVPKDFPEPTETASIIEKIPKDTVIFAMCSNGHGRSKFIAKLLGGMGYDNCRAIGYRDLWKLDKDADWADLRNELMASPVIICGNSDVVGELSNYEDGKFVKDKIIIDLKMLESYHAIASGYMTKEMQAELVKKLIKQLEELGFSNNNQEGNMSGETDESKELNSEQHPLLDFADAVLANPESVGLKKDFNLDEERTTKEGDVTLEAFNKIFRKTGLSEAEIEKIIKIFNLIGDSKGKTGGEVLFSVLEATSEED